MSGDKRLRPAGRRCGWLCAAGTLVLATAWCAAETPPAGPFEGLLGPPAPGLLLMHTGRLVEGNIARGPAGFVVEKPNGSTLVPYNHVRLHAADLSDAYRQLRTTLSTTSGAAGHLGLARWCVTHELYAEAGDELRMALALDPRSTEARSMLARLEELANPGRPVQLDVPRPQPKAADGFAPAESRSLASLSPEAAQQFVTRVQPILSNKCGNASCHGTDADHRFQLTNVRLGSGSHRVFAERNLAEVLRYVDHEQPDRSPLLTVPRGNHGQGGRAIFHGPGSTEQLELLQEWVRQVAGEQSARGRRQQTKPALLTDSPPAATAPSPGRPDDAFNNPPPEEPEPEDVLQKVLREERRDAFDPDLFNRAVQGERHR